MPVFLLLIIGVAGARAQQPTIVSFSPATVCQGDNVTITGTNFNGVTTVKLGSDNAAIVSVNNDSTVITATVSATATSGPVVVITPGGTVTSTNTLTILPSPTPGLIDAGNPDAPFTNCNGNSTYQLRVTNNSSTTGSGNAYKIDWGDGASFTQTDWPANAQTTHTYTAQGYFVIKLTITPANGCTRSVTYQFYNGANPLASFSTSTSTTGLCAPAAVQFQIGNWFNNSTGTTYLINWGDGTPNVTLTHPLNGTNTVQLISHTYGTTSCPNTDFTATLKASNGCFTTTYTLDEIIIRKKPTADFSTQPMPACLSTPVCFTNQTINGYSGNTCNTTSTFTWDLGDGTTSTAATPPCHTYATAGTYTITLTASNTTCGSDVKTKQLVVLPTSPVPTATPVTYCKGQTASPLTATGSGLLWYTVASGGTGSATAPTPSTNTPGTVTYYVSQTLANSCESPRIPVTVTVYALPAAPVVTTPVQLCLNQTASPLTASGSGLLWYNSATGGVGSATAPTPSTGAIGSTTYYVSQTTNGCEGPRAAIVVTVNALATAPVVTSPITYCQNQAAAPLTATGSNLLWYTSATGGTGSSTAPTPSTATPGSTTYYVSQVTGCGEGPRSSITVNVNASPSATIAYNPVNLCNVVNTAATPNPPVTVMLTGTPNGNYSITPATGLPIDAVTGTLNPSGATAGTYVIKYSIAGTGGCSTFTTTATVTVSSTPSATIAYPAICSSDASTSVKLTGAAGGTFASTTGLTIDPSTGAITPATSTPGAYTVTYTIAPASPCPGFSTTANVTITQAPAASIAYNPANLCNVVNTAATPNAPVNVTFTGTTGGVYTVVPANGLNINAATGTIDPSGATAGNYTIKYTVAGTGGCSSVTATALITVSGTPSATIVYPDSVCSSDAATTVQLTGSRGGVFTSTAGLTIDPSTGTITPSGSTPGTYTITYTVSPAAPCPGFSTTKVITIKQAPSATISYSPATLCNVNTATSSNPPIPVLQTGTPGGVYSITPAGLPIDAATGTINPSGATAGLYTIKYSIPGASGCATYSVSTTVTVSGTPTATITYTDSVCSSDAVASVKLTGNQGGVFTSTAGLTIDANTGAISPSTSTPGHYVITYTIAASPPCPGFTTTGGITITPAPSAAISYSPAALCNVSSAANPNPPVPVVQTGTPGGSYSIVPVTGLPIDPATGMITPAGATPGTYTIKYTIAGKGGCSVYSTTTTVTVSAAPTATISYKGAPFCRGITVAQKVTLTGNTGGTFTAGTGLSINATTGDINPALSTPGTYTITYTIAASSPCPGYTTTTSVEIDDSPVLTFSPSTQSICSGGTAGFTPSSTVANTTYTWSVVGALPPNVTGTVAGTASGASPVISLSFVNTGTSSQTLTIQVIPTNPSPTPCPGAPYNLTLVVNPIPAALAPDTFHICMGVPPVTLSVSPSPGNTIKWYDKNLVLLSAAPVIATNVPGQFTYYVSQSNSSACESPKSNVLAIVHPTPKIVGSSYTNPTACGIPSGSIVLQVLDLDNNPIPHFQLLVHYNKFQTALTMPDSTDATGKVVIPLTAGTYSGIYVEANGCVSQPIPDVFILQDPSPPAPPVAGYNPPLCSETTLTLTALSPTSTQAGPIDYVWAGPAFGKFADTVRNTVISFPSAPISYAGTYVVYALQNNCISLPASFEVIIKQAPAKPVIVTRTPLCIGDNLSLQAFSSIPGPGGTLNYVWKGPGAGFPVNSAIAGVNHVTLADAGIYSITVSSPQTGCSVTTDTLIQIGGYPIVQFARDTFTLPTGYLLQLAPVITNAADPGILPIKKYEWTPSQDIACNDSVCATPVATIKNNVCYAVKATNIYGCSGGDTLCVKVFCQSSQLFIPNAFAPHGDVPENRKLIVRATGIGTVKSFRVFNRWGKIVFEKNNFPPNSAEFGWDGMVNGRMADPGVYVYTADVICENGIPYSFKGNVTLF